MLTVKRLGSIMCQKIMRKGRRSCILVRQVVTDRPPSFRALEEKEINEVMEGKFLPVEPQDKLTAMWAHIKRKAL